MNRDAWLKERQKGIGGSDIAAIMGLTKWKSPLDVYLDKKGLSEPQPDNEAMYWGRVLEPKVLVRYRELSKNIIKHNVTNEIIIHPEFDFMGATPDGWILENGVTSPPTGLLEIKTSNRYAKGWGTTGTDDIPPPYLLQVQYYMGICNLPKCELAALVGGNDFKIYHIYRNDDLIDTIYRHVKKFWFNVQNDILPDVDGSEATKKALAVLFRNPTGDMVEDAADIRHIVGELAILRSKRDRINDDMLFNENQIKSLIGNHRGIIGDDYRITWSKTSPKPKVDYRAAFEAACEESTDITAKIKIKLETENMTANKPNRVFRVSGELFKKEGE